MSHWINLVTPYGRMNGWSAEPDDKPNGGVVLVHDLFGVNEDIRAIAERYAEEGYLTVAPALFDKIQREVEMTYEAENQRLGADLAERLGFDTAVELVKTTADAIGHAGKVAIIGYGWGGAVALRAAAVLDASCVSYYGDVALDMEGEKTFPLLLHHGAADDRFAPDKLDLYQDSYPGLETFSYPAGVIFDRESHPLYHHAESAELAFQQTRRFLRDHIRHENDV